MIVNSSLYRKIPYRFRNGLKLNVSVKLGNQVLTIPTTLESAVVNVYWKRSWKTEIFERFIEEEKGLFIDVGANVGQTLLDLKIVKPAYSYIGFEPNCLCVNYLRELIHLNSIENYQIFPVGLSDTGKCLPLFRHKDNVADSCASIVPNLRPDRQYDVDIVPCFGFDEVRRSLALGNVSFIKIDVEGAELETLIGMETSIRECRPIILCEVLFTDSKGDLRVQDERNAKLLQLLTSLRYKVVQIIKSADIRNIVAFKVIQSFSSGYWNRDNKELCDYLFFPEEVEAKVLSTFSAGE